MSCRDPKEALEQAVSLGMNTILTSGQQNSAVKGAELLAELQRQAAGHIRIQAGGGICADAIRELYPKTDADRLPHVRKNRTGEPDAVSEENVNMGLPSLSEYTLYRTDVKAVRSARGSTGRTLTPVDKKSPVSPEQWDELLKET